MKVLIAEDDDDFRFVLGAIIAAEPSMTLVGAAGDAEEAIQLARESEPDVALLDVGMPKGGGVRAARAIREVSPITKVMALSGSGEKDAVIRMLRAGATAYLIKGATPGEILTAIRDTASGRTTLAPDAAREVIQIVRHMEGKDLGEPEHAEDRAFVEGLLTGKGLDLALQPIFDLNSDAIVGHEVLARFDIEPRRPDVWFRRAEAVGLRAELELAVLRKALTFLPCVPAQTFLSINLSPDVVVSKEDDIGIGRSDGRRIVIELTEHAPVDNYGELSASLAEMRAVGVRFAVDDAGAGFASLQHILQLAPEFIKLDTSLTRHIDHDSPRRALASSLITFATHMHATMIAEGVETRDEFQALRDLGVTHGQGYYLGRPAPFGECRSGNFAPERLSRLLQETTSRVRRASSATEAIEALGVLLSREFSLWRVSLRALAPENQLVVVASWPNGHSPVPPGTTMSALATSLPEVLRRNGPVCSTDPFAYPSFTERVMRDAGLQSWITLPVHNLDGAIIGLLSFSSQATDTFGESSLDFFTQLGNAVESPLAALLR